MMFKALDIQCKLRDLKRGKKVFLDTSSSKFAALKFINARICNGLGGNVNFSEKLKSQCSQTDLISISSLISPLFILFFSFFEP